MLLHETFGVGESLAAVGAGEWSIKRCQATPWEHDEQEIVVWQWVLSCPAMGRLVTAGDEIKLAGVTYRTSYMSDGDGLPLLVLTPKNRKEN